MTIPHSPGKQISLDVEEVQQKKIRRLSEQCPLYKNANNVKVEKTMSMTQNVCIDKVSKQENSTARWQH